MNITQAARAILRDQLVHIANSGKAEALQALLSGAGLPATTHDAEAAEQIHDALEAGDRYANLARRIARLLARLIQRRTDALEQRLAALEGAAIAGGSTQAFERCYLEDETYVFNLFLLASALPRQEELFVGLQRFHEIGFQRDVVLASSNNRVGFQLRRALAEQQSGSELRAYWMDLLEERGRNWNPARRTELLEAWHGLLATLDFDADLQDTLSSLDKGLRALHGSIERHPEAIALLEMALWRLGNAYPLDPLTWVSYLSPAWAKWPELLQDVATRTWPGLEPKAHEEMPLLPDDLDALVAAMQVSDQEKLRDILQRGAADEARNLINGLVFSPPTIAGQPPQAVRTLLNRLLEHLWPTGKRTVSSMTQHEGEEWAGSGYNNRPARRGSIDRLARLEAVNRTLTEIERRLSEGDDAAARRFLDELLEQQRNSPLADRYLHTAKTLANAATIVQRFGELEWAERLLREACRENHDDEVSANGLADVLKARGELEAAETQYRQNTARWPNNEVSACGLADVLKARGELEAAETQYRQNTARWPNDEVSANGLADVLKARGELEAAETQYRQNTARWPNDRIAVNGLANVLRKQKRHVEALELLSDRSGSLVTPQDTYDLHLRAMILLDLGRLGDARVALELGLKAVLAPRDPAAFRSGLALVALREREFEAARTILSALPANVIPLDLIRLHVEAAQNRGDQAGNLARVLGGRQSQMKFGEVRVFELVRNGFGISSAGVGRQPANDELDEIFDAEIELLLAA